ncbi:MAG: sodium-dependent transporter, partial [Bacteroidaceae bacterium]|nr:sodium-dependent transporter [Bacteroidaceae bacterium]
YFSKHTPLVRSATISALLDTLVAVLAAVMIFPVVFSYGFSPEAGPKLVFEVLPSVFTKFPFSGFWCSTFFLLLFFASLSSTISMSEIFISFVCEEHKMRRTNATILNTVIALVFGTLCSLSFGPLSNLTILDNTIFDLFNNISSNILLPIGGISFSLFVGWGIKWEIIVKELTDDGKRKITLIKPLIFCIRVVAPTAVIIIFLSGLGLFSFILK